MTEPGTQSNARSWFAHYKPNPDARLRLFCFPYAGGSAQTYRRWSESLPGIEVFPVQLPGRGSRLFEPLFTDHLTTIHAIAGAIQPYLDKPFALFGHSLGGLIAYELAHLLLDSHGLSPIHLLVSSHRAPHLPNTDRKVHDLPEDELIQEIIRLNGTPQQVLDSPELMKMILPLIRADFQIYEEYVYSSHPKLPCPVTVYGGLGDSCVTCDQLQEWEQHTDAQFSMKMMPGDHFFIHTSERELLNSIYQQLARTSSAATDPL